MVNLESTRIKNVNSIDILPFEKDIYVHHELNKDSGFMVDKASIIHGEVPVDYENRNGEIDVISSKENWYNHWIYFRYYLKNYYVTDQLIQQWYKSMNKDYFRLIVQFLSTYKDVIFLDTTDLDEEEKY